MILLQSPDFFFKSCKIASKDVSGSQVSMKKPQVMVLSVSLLTPPSEAVFYSGLPVGPIDAIKAAYGPIVQILGRPKDGYNLTMKLYLLKLPSNEGSASFLPKIIMSFCYE